MALIPVMVGPITLYTAIAGTMRPNGGRAGQPVKWGSQDGDPKPPGNSPWSDLFRLRTRPNTIKWNLGDERTEVETGQSIYAIGEVRNKGMVQISGECFDLRLDTLARLKRLQMTTIAAAGDELAYRELYLEETHHVDPVACLLVGQSPDIYTRNRGLNLYIPYATLKGPDEVAGNETEPSTYTFMIKGIKAPGVRIADIVAEFDPALTAA